MSDDHDELYLRTLRAEEAAGLRVIAFWERQPPELIGPGWVGIHLESLERQLESTYEAIRAIESGKGR